MLIIYLLNNLFCFPTAKLLFIDKYQTFFGKNIFEGEGGQKKRREFKD